MRGLLENHEDLIYYIRYFNNYNFYKLKYENEENVRLAGVEHIKQTKIRQDILILLPWFFLTMHWNTSTPA